MSFLKKGSQVFLSKKGHKDFFYPDIYSTETILEDTQVSQLSWVGSMEFLPVLIPETSIFANGDAKKMIPVWIKKGMLKSAKSS